MRLFLSHIYTTFCIISFNLETQIVQYLHTDTMFIQIILSYETQVPINQNYGGITIMLMEHKTTFLNSESNNLEVLTIIMKLIKWNFTLMVWILVGQT